MTHKIMISLSGRNQAWFDKLSKKDQREYLKAHPNSKFGANSGKKVATKSTVKTKTKAAPKKSASAKPATKSTKKTAPKKAASKGVQRKSKPAPTEVHHNTDELHGHALKQKKALIDNMIAPYAKELARLRNKRDAGDGLSNDESKRYKQLLVTIAHLHKGR